MRMHEVIYSPNRKHKFRFENINEIRFGPQYGKIVFNKVALPLWYGAHAIWSEDSKYLALQQWLTTTESQGPNTRIALIDTQSMKLSFLSAIKGFVEPKKFEAEKIIYQKRIFTSAGEAGGEYEVAIPEISNWIDIPVPPLGFVEAVNFLLVPFMEQIGFGTKGVTFSGDGYEVEFSNDDCNLTYCDFGRLDPPALVLKTSASGWLNYKSLIAKYTNTRMPELTDYVAVIQTIESTFPHILSHLESSKTEPELEPIKLGHEDVLARTVYTFPEWKISIMANGDESRYFIGYPASLVPHEIETIAYDELSLDEIAAWKSGKLDIRDASSRRIEKSIRKTNDEIKNMPKPLGKYNFKLGSLRKLIGKIFRK